MKIDVTNQSVTHHQAQHGGMSSSFNPRQDTYNSLSSPLAASCGSWYTTVKNWVLIIPNALLSLVRRTIYLLTCCKFCGNTLSAEEKRDAIQHVLHVWKDVGDVQEKQKAWTEMTSRYPYLEGILIEAYVDIARGKVLGAKQTSPEKIKEWNEANSETVKKNAITMVRECNVKVLEDYLKHLQPELIRE